MKTVDTLIQLAKLGVDTCQRELSQLLEIEEAINTAIQILDQEVRDERVFAATADQGGSDYAFYLQRAKQKRATLLGQRAQLQPQIDDARNRLAEAFEEQKKFEITAERRTAEAEAEEDKRQQQTLDEIGLRRDNKT